MGGGLHGNVGRVPARGPSPRVLQSGGQQLLEGLQVEARLQLQDVVLLHHDNCWSTLTSWSRALFCSYASKTWGEITHLCHYTSHPAPA